MREQPPIGRDDSRFTRAGNPPTSPSHRFDHLRLDIPGDPFVTEKRCEAKRLLEQTGDPSNIPQEVFLLTCSAALAEIHALLAHTTTMALLYRTPAFDHMFQPLNFPPPDLLA